MTLCIKAKPPAGLLLISILSLLLLACQGSPQASQAPATESTNAPNGNWYTTHRHMVFQAEQGSLIDTINGPNGNQIMEYNIDRIVYHKPGIYMLTLSANLPQTTTTKRMFVFSKNFRTMREFQGSHVIYWKRTP